MWFSQSTLVASTTKTNHQDTTETLLRLSLSTYYPSPMKGSCGCDRMLVGFTTTCAIGANRH